MADSLDETAAQWPGKQTVSGDEFLKLFEEKTGPLSIRSLVVTEPVSLDSDVYQCKGVRFIDCIFLGDITFNDIDLKSGVHFVSSRVDGTLEISGCKATNVDTRRTIRSVANFAFSNCKVNDLFIEGYTDLYKGLIIGNESEISNLYLFEIFSSYDKDRGISISNSTVTNYFEISELESVSKVNISNCKVHCKTEIFDCEALSFSMIGASVFQKQVQFRDCAFDSILVSGPEFQAAFETTNLTVGEEIEVSDTSFGSTSVLDLRTITVVDDSESEGEGETDTASIGKFTVSTSDISSELTVFSADGSLEIERLKVSCSSRLKGAIRFNDIRVEELNLTGTNSGLSLIFERALFHHVRIDGFLNSGNLAFQSCCSTENEGSSFETYDSSLGKTEFRNFLFQSFKQVIISTSQWSQITYSSTKWFKDEQLKTLTDPDPLVVRKDFFSEEELKREVYRQLKYASERQGDRVQALVFKAREHKAYRKHIKFCKDWKGSNYWILKFNWTNDHGLNWIRPLALTLLATALFYPIELIEASPNLTWTFDWSPEGRLRVWDLMNENLGVYWQMLNPTRRTDIVFKNVIGKGGRVSALVYFLETFHRIILTYLVFQTISAFRKFVK